MIQNGPVIIKSIINEMCQSMKNHNEGCLMLKCNQLKKITNFFNHIEKNKLTLSFELVHFNAICNQF